MIQLKTTTFELLESICNTELITAEPDHFHINNKYVRSKCLIGFGLFFVCFLNSSRFIY